MFNVTPSRTSTYCTRKTNNIPLFNFKHKFLKSSFFPFSVIKCSIFNPSFRDSSSFPVFKKRRILNFIRPTESSFFNCDYSKGIIFVTRFRLGPNHLREHKFRITLFFLVALMLNQWTISFYTTPCSWLKGKPQILIQM